MEENISNIVSQEAFEQLAKLGRMLSENTDTMEQLIRKASEFRKALDGATNIQQMSSAVEGLSQSTQQLNKTQSERLNIERQIKVEGQKMAEQIQNTDAVLDGAREAMKRVRLENMDAAASYIKIQNNMKKFQSQLKELQKKYTERQRDGSYLTASDEDQELMQKLTIAIQKQKVALSELQVQMKENAKESFFGQDAYSGSMDELNARLGKMRDTYRSLTEEERENADIGGVLSAAINALDEKLKGLDKSIGNNQRNVGNYDILLDRITNGEVSLRTAMMSLRKDMAALQMQRDQMKDTIREQTQLTERLASEQGTESEEYRESASKLEEMKRAYDQLQGSLEDITSQTAELNKMQKVQMSDINAQTDPNSGINALSQGFGLLTNSYQGAITAIALFGGESEGLKETLAKVMIAQQALNAVQQIANDLKKTSLVRIKAEAAWNKIRLAFTKEQTAAEVKNTVATQGAAAATTELAAGEVAATGAAGGLTVGIKAVGTAIKSIPVIGWILAAAAALTTVITLVVKANRAEKEGNELQQQRKKLIQAETDAKQQAFSATQREVLELRNAVAQLQSLKAGTKEYKEQVNVVADKLGVSNEWLIKNVDKVNLLADAWVNVKKAQALSTAYIEAAADRQVKLEQTIIDFQRAEYKERKKILEDSGLFSKQQIDNINTAAHNMGVGSSVVMQMFDDARLANDKIADNLVSKSNDAMNAVKSDIKAVTDAQNAGNSQRSQSNDDFANAEKHRLEVIRATEEKKAKSFREIYDMRAKYLKEDYEAELRQYGLTQQQRDAITQKYEAEKAELDLNEKKRQLAAIDKANAEAAKLLMDINEQRVKSSTMSEKDMTDMLVMLNRERLYATLSENQKAFKEETENLEENSAEYLAIKKSWDAKNEKEAEDSAERERQIRENGFNETLRSLEQATQDNINRRIALGETGFTLQQSIIQDEIAGIDAQIAALEKAQDAEHDYTSAILALRAQRKQKSDEYAANELANIEAERDARIGLGQAIGESFLAIGNAMTEGIKDEKQRVIVEQALAMAQVMLSQGVALAKAIEAGTKDGATKGNVVAMYATIATAVGTVIAQIVSAKNAISAANSSIAQANAYAEGTDYHRGGDAVVGEGGSPELVMAGGRSYVVDRPTFIRDLPVGSKVIPLTDNLATRHTVDLTKIEDGISGLMGKSVVNINVSDRIVALLSNGQSRTRILNRQFRH